MDLVAVQRAGHPQIVAEGRLIVGEQRREILADDRVFAEGRRVLREAHAVSDPLGHLLACQHVLEMVLRQNEGKAGMEGQQAGWRFWSPWENIHFWSQVRT